MYRAYKTLIATTLAMALMASSAIAAQTISVITTVNVRPVALHRIERALTTQLDRQVRPWWRTPKIRFAPGGLQLTVMPLANVQLLARQPGVSVQGFHGFVDGQPYAVVGWDGSLDDLSLMMSHELLELLVDPTGTATIDGYLKEPADPVSDNGYQIGDVTVSDFVTPGWFIAGSTGPWNQMRSIRQGNYDAGYIDRPDQGMLEGGPIGS